MTGREALYNRSQTLPALPFYAGIMNKYCKKQQKRVL